MSDLETLFPDREITVGGTSLTVSPFPFGKMPKVMALAKPIVKALGDAGIMAINENGTIGVNSSWPLHIVDLFADAGEDLIALVAFLTGQPRDWFDTLGQDDGIALTKKVFEVNADFFVKKVLPMLGLSFAPATDGAPSSPDSSGPATADPISTDTPSDKSSST
ncbi:MAG: hypothetical protein B7Z62_02045 [Deltaproteobacteria bacterium 37-65-8]|nr:MAG: hypothetical protein B7Z62_02045 [Deltaproteobacteria bacterium 37-65-8]